MLYSTVCSAAYMSQYSNSWGEDTILAVVWQVSQLQQPKFKWEQNDLTQLTLHIFPTAQILSVLNDRFYVGGLL